MSGGIGYVLDDTGDFRTKCNREMVEIEALNDYDITLVRTLLYNHHRYTKSDAAKAVLDDFAATMKRFVKVMPIEYKRILDTKKINEQMKLAGSYDG
jgi:glutamate synthase domain-containing protein 3